MKRKRDSKAETSTKSHPQYEVFLSFFGDDTRLNFTDYLYEDLKHARIETFRDNEELRVGEKIKGELRKAIKNSKISIPILSENYASSKWCLLELEQMVKCYKNKGQKIYPIFYKVSPSDVRKQKKSYKKAFRVHEKEFDNETVERWRQALRVVAELKGLELEKETGGYEGRLVKIVVDEVRLYLKRDYTSEPDVLVGIDEHVENLKGLLKVDAGGVRIVGIHGMGGLGKTTIAKITYNQLCQSFDTCCFLDNVRESSSQHNGLLHLQGQLISKIERRGDPNISNVDEGRRRIKEVCGIKMLLVLDDVDDYFKEVDKLMGSLSWFGSQSRIIITTRNTSVLSAIEKEGKSEGLNEFCERYNPKFMDDHDSLRLFSKNAFKRDFPMEGYEHLSEEIVSIAAGLPLVLVVLGKTFFAMEGKHLWEEKVRELRELPNKEVLDKLRFSYETLEDAHKQIFLDIACFFIGRDVTRTSYMWTACNFYPLGGVNTLINRSLITIGSNNTFIMHDQLRDLGRNIGKQSRLMWRGEDAMKVIETSQGTGRSDVVGLDLGFQWKGSVLASTLCDLPNLRYLDMGCQNIDGDFNHHGLKWIRNLGNVGVNNWQTENLVILEVFNFGDCLLNWNAFQMGKKLKVLDISCNARELPDLSAYASLEILKLTNTSVCKLDGLEHLKHLKHLHVSSCEDLEMLPSLSNLTNLVHLDLILCTALRRVSSVSNLKRLKEFVAAGCENLIEIEGFEGLESLTRLDLRECESLKLLPDVSNLKRLETFDATECGKLTEIKGLDKLESLTKLDLSMCESLKLLPDVSNLKRLERFEACGCVDLIEIKGLDKLESLKHLDLSDCSSLERIPDVSNLKKLYSFEGNGCVKVTEILGIDKLNSLRWLSLNNCSSLKGAVNLSNLTDLKQFHAPTLEVTNFLCFKNEETLHVKFSDSLIEYCTLNPSGPSVQVYGRSMRRLPKLLSGCKNLSVIDCDEIEDLDGLNSLEHIFIHSCKKLIEIQGLNRLVSLVRLNIVDCPSLERLPDLPNTGMLSMVNVKYCENLDDIERLGAVESLEHLSIYGCYKIKEIPNLQKLKNLKTLDIRDLNELTSLHGLEKLLKSLESLRITDCNSIEALPDLSSFNESTQVYISCCAKLTDLSRNQGPSSSDRTLSLLQRIGSH